MSLLSGFLRQEACFHAPPTHSYVNRRSSSVGNYKKNSAGAEMAALQGRCVQLHNDRLLGVLRDYLEPGDKHSEVEKFKRIFGSQKN